MPRSYAPPGYVEKHEGDYMTTMGYLENGNQRCVSWLMCLTSLCVRSQFCSCVRTRAPSKGSAGSLTLSCGLPRQGPEWGYCGDDDNTSASGRKKQQLTGDNEQVPAPSRVWLSEVWCSPKAVTYLVFVVHVGHWDLCGATASGARVLVRNRRNVSIAGYAVVACDMCRMLPRVCYTPLAKETVLHALGLRR